MLDLTRNGKQKKWPILSNKQMRNEKSEKKGRKMDVQSQKNKKSRRAFLENGKNSRLISATMENKVDQSVETWNGLEQRYKSILGRRTQIKVDKKWVSNLTVFEKKWTSDLTQRKKLKTDLTRIVKNRHPPPHFPRLLGGLSEAW